MNSSLRSVSLLSIAVVMLFAASHSRATDLTLEQVQSGALLIPAERAGHYQPTTTLYTDVDILVTGMLAHTELRQNFRNDSDNWVEAIYVFPLPANASVHAMQMKIGERMIDGVIKTREQARRTYDEAKARGSHASLVERQRPNLFTSRVANIPPHEVVSVSISYQSQVRYDDGMFALRFPMTLTPRYIPGQRLRQAGVVSENASYKPSAHGWAAPTTSVPDADEITPNMTATHNAANTTIEVEISAGVPLSQVISESHSVNAVKSADTWLINLNGTSVPADRDFTLQWHPVAGSSPTAAVFQQQLETDDGEQSFASLMLVPPQNLYDVAIAAREVIFVIDTSGSMEGNSIVQARAALQLGIDRLSDQDRFNVIEFNDQTRQLFASATQSSQSSKQQAKNWVAGLYANGGTEIAHAMSAALESNHSVSNHSATRSEDNSLDYIRQVIFITDGSVGNEDEIFTQIQNNIGTNRLFTVAIGSAPNTWFMRKAAELGRGTYTSIARETEVSEKMLGLFYKLERPVLTNVELSWEGVESPEMYPLTLPDLYAGEPVLADARWLKKVSGGALMISGEHAGGPWNSRLSLGSFDNRKGLAKLWAHRKIEALEDSMLFESTPAQMTRIEKEITNTALEYSLVTRYTSLVAVEREIARDPAASNLKVAELPSAMPAGNTMAMPQGSVGITLRLMVAALLAMLALLNGNFSRVRHTVLTLLRRVKAAVSMSPIHTRSTS